MPTAKPASRPPCQLTPGAAAGLAPASAGDASWLDSSDGRCETPAELEVTPAGFGAAIGGTPFPGSAGSQEVRGRVQVEQPPGQRVDAGVRAGGVAGIDVELAVDLGQRVRVDPIALAQTSRSYMTTPTGSGMSFS